MSQPPPQTLDGAKILEYAVLDESVTFTGKLHLLHDGERVGPVPCLAICRDPHFDELLLLHCDSSWRVLGGQIGNSPEAPSVTTVDEVKRRVEKYYSDVARKWQKI
jgi:hypothetical protein